MLMAKTFALFSVASVANGMTWWIYVIAQGDPKGLWEIIQLGGTGGLILSLLGAVWTLWKDRIQQQGIIRDERTALQTLIQNEREQHRKEIMDLRVQQQSEVKAATEMLMKAYKEQIDTLRADIDLKYAKVTRVEEIEKEIG